MSYSIPGTVLIALHAFKEEKDTLELKLRELHFCYMSLDSFFHWDNTDHHPNLEILEGAILGDFFFFFSVLIYFISFFAF